MKLRYSNLFITLIYIFFLTGCIKVDFNIEEKIVPPEDAVNALQGTWIIEKCLSLEGKKEDASTASKYLGKYAVFDNKISVLGGDTCINPEYKIRNVGSNDYLLSKYKTSAEKFGLEKEKIDVVTVTSKNQVFYDFIIIDYNNLLVCTGDNFLYLHKVSDKIDKTVKENSLRNSSKRKIKSVAEEDSLLRSAVLLGIRSSENTYKTIWVATRNKELKPIMYTEQLFVPRMKGFWEVGAYKEVTNNGTTSSIYANSLTSPTSEKSKAKMKNVLTEKVERRITFIGNDYIGTEYDSRFQVIPIDNIGISKGIDISDIANENGYTSMLRSSEAFISSLDKDKSKLIMKNPRRDNFTLQRRNGHWIMKGRLDYKHYAQKNSYEDFDINIMIPLKLISYDELYIPWSEIKSRIPEALDAFVSPNKDIALIEGKGSIYVYSIKDGKLSEQPLKKVYLDEGDSIVMAEWAIGEYAEKWERFVGQKFTPLGEEFE